MSIQSNKEYNLWLKEIKEKIRTSQIRAALSVNQSLMELYWDIGKEIVFKQQNYAWGNNVVEQLSSDLKHEFPEISGFSRRNLYAMRQWYLFYFQRFEFVPQLVAQIPWDIIVSLSVKLKMLKQLYFIVRQQLKMAGAEMS